MKIRSDQSSSPSYPAYGALKGLLIGTSVTAALALVSCGKAPQDKQEAMDGPSTMKANQMNPEGDLPPKKKPVDTDRDGVVDSKDKCPKVMGSPAHDGCPVPQPPVVTGGVAPRRVKPPPPLPPHKGGTTQVPKLSVDSDGDGLPDAQDRCVSQKGPASNKGCPVPRKRLRGRPVPPRRPMGSPKTPLLPE